MPDAVAPADVDETPLRDETPSQAARRLAHAKAAAVTAAADDAFVLAADTVVACGRRILPKALARAEAGACLRLLSGRRHDVLTAVVAVAPGGRRAERLSRSVVTFARLTPPQIEALLDAGDWHGKAGGYAIQGHAAPFIRHLAGSYSGVVGLPLYETAAVLRGLGWPCP